MDYGATGFWFENYRAARFVGQKNSFPALVNVSCPGWLDKQLWSNSLETTKCALKFFFDPSPSLILLVFHKILRKLKDIKGSQTVFKLNGAHIKFQK